MAGVLTNTMGATDIKGIDIDGDTNDFSFAGTDYYFNEITRDIAGSRTSRPTTTQGFHKQWNWLYDYSGTGVGGSGVVKGTGGKFFVNGDIKPVYAPVVTQTWQFFETDSIIELQSTADIDSTGAPIKLEMFGARYYAQLSAGALTQNTKALEVNLIGGEFQAIRSSATINGAPTMNYYGGRFLATGGTEGTSTAHGGYFKAASADANYAIYTDGGTILIKEQAAAETDKTGYGQLWVKNDTPNKLYFTDDAGTDHEIAFV